MRGAAHPIGRDKKFRFDATGRFELGLSRGGVSEQGKCDKGYWFHEIEVEFELLKMCSSWSKHCGRELMAACLRSRRSHMGPWAYMAKGRIVGEPLSHAQ